MQKESSTLNTRTANSQNSHDAFELKRSIPVETLKVVANEYVHTWPATTPKMSSWWVFAPCPWIQPV